ncbi:MAG: hypothetical protein ACTSSI_11935 [Candidatus Helarchaeota archaeon]
MNRESFFNSDSGALITSKSFFRPAIEIRGRLQGAQDLLLEREVPATIPEVDSNIRASPQTSQVLPIKDHLRKRFESLNNQELTDQAREMLLETHPTLKKRLIWERDVNTDRRVLKNIRDIPIPSPKDEKNEIKGKKNLDLTKI